MKPHRMAGIFSFHSREAIRVKVKKCEGLLQPEYRKFSVDPQITSFEVLQSILARAFDIKGEFTISYLAKDDCNQETYLSLLSDWDLDAAFLNASDPCLRLKVDLKPFEEGLEDWDIIAPVDVPRPAISGNSDKPTIAGTILNQMEKTLNLVQRALNLTNDSAESVKPLKPPMTDAEFHNFLDSDGRLVSPKELRISIYQGGLEASLRRVVWKHLLNVYKEGMSGRERIDYIKRKSFEYLRLRDVWQTMVNNGTVTEEMQVITNMVRKDVLRTDRTHKFYAGADDNKNVVSLFNLLTTYALNHPSVSYCQGMSDLASPLLVTLKDEAQAYICFCALMKRLKPNFLLDGKAMTLKFQHLSEALQVYDPEFYEYLKENQADDLLFCYRWLLLELKREFAFDDALRMLEVLWSSIPPNPPQGDLQLYEIEFSPLSPHSPKLFSKENPYTKVRAMRRQSSTSSICGTRAKVDANSNSANPTHNGHADESLEINNSMDQSTDSKNGHPPRVLLRQESFADGESNDDSQEYFPMTTSVTRELRMELENLNSRLPGSGRYFRRTLTIESEDLESPLSNDNDNSEHLHHGTITENVQNSTSESEEEESVSVCSESDFSSVDQIKKAPEIHRSPSKSPKVPRADKCSTPDEQKDLDYEDRSEEEGSTHCNGEILENEILADKDHKAHLKCVIPIHLVRERSSVEAMQRRGSDSSDSLQENLVHDNVAITVSEPNMTRHSSEGYVSEEVSSKEASIQEDRDRLLTACQSSTSVFTDSGLVESMMTNSCEEASESIEYSTPKSRVHRLPTPNELGSGNPFMIFLCLTLLLQHRDYIMKNHMDYNELAMHFDKMVRKHNVNRVLHQARNLYSEYMRAGWQEKSDSSDYQDLSV